MDFREEDDGFTVSSSPSHGRGGGPVGSTGTLSRQAVPTRDFSNLLMSQRKGLSNEVGANNCFLNVVIQSLWHIRSFRTIITTGEHAVHHRPDLQASSSCKEQAPDSRVRSFDRATMTFAKTPCLLCELERIFVFYQYAEDPVLEVDRVRIALSTLFELGEMNDATETLETILDALHVDTFNQMLVMRQETTLTASQPAIRSQASDLANSIICEPRCVAHLLFQMNLMDLKICSNPQCGATTEPIMNTDFLYRVYAQEILRNCDTRSLEEVLYLEAQGKCSDASGAVSSCELCTKGKMNMSRWILTLPMVFAVSVIWSSPTVNKEDVRKWMKLLSSQRHHDDKATINLSKIFQTEHSHNQAQSGGRQAKSDPASCAGQDAEYVFRGLVCYYGRHYVGFFASRSEENGQTKERWFLFDDTRVKRVGNWEDVRYRIERGGYQPTLLFYERKNINQPHLEKVALEIHEWWKETSEKYMQLHRERAKAKDSLREEDEEEDGDVRRVDNDNLDDEEIFAHVQDGSDTAEAKNSRPPLSLPFAPTPASSSLNIYEDLHHYHKSAEETLSRLNGILRGDSKTGASALSGSVRRMSFRKREYSYHSVDSVQDVNRDAIFQDKNGSPSPKHSPAVKGQVPVSPIAVKSSSPSNSFGLGTSIREIHLNVSDDAKDTNKDEEAEVEVAARSMFAQEAAGNAASSSDGGSQVFEVALNASDGGLGLVLRDEVLTLTPQEQSDRGMGANDALEKQFVVTGFETSARTGKKLPAEASGMIQRGDVLLAINQQSTRGQNLLQVMETLVVSENPVNLLFHRVAPWTCPRCTLHNARDQASCAACGLEMQLYR